MSSSPKSVDLPLPLPPPASSSAPAVPNGIQSSTPAITRKDTLSVSGQPTLGLSNSWPNVPNGPTTLDKEKLDKIDKSLRAPPGRDPKSRARSREYLKQ